MECSRPSGEIVDMLNQPGCHGDHVTWLTKTLKSAWLTWHLG